MVTEEDTNKADSVIRSSDILDEMLELQPVNIGDKMGSDFIEQQHKMFQISNEQLEIRLQKLPQRREG